MTAALALLLCVGGSLACAAGAGSSLTGTQVVCPAASCGKRRSCSRGGLACATRSLALQQLGVDAAGATFSTAAQVVGPAPKAGVLRARQYSAVDRAAGRYFVMLQPVAESTSNVTSVGAPRLFVASAASWPNSSSAATVAEIALRMAGTHAGSAAGAAAAVPPMEAVELAPAGTGAGAKLLGVGRRGALYAIDVAPGSPTAGAVTVLSPAMWNAPALLTQGLTALDTAGGTLYALAQMPQYVGTNDPVCGNTHGERTCNVSIMAFDLRAGAGATARNVSSLLYCFDGSNAQLGCRGTNVQRMWFAPPSAATATATAMATATATPAAAARLAAVTRTTKDGPAVSSIDIASGAVATVYRHPGDDVYEFISSRGYDDGALPPNPSAFDPGTGTVYLQLRTGVKRFLLGVPFPGGGPPTTQVDLPAPAAGGAGQEPFAHMELF
eukprot:g4348.t1